MANRKLSQPIVGIAGDSSDLTLDDLKRGGDTPHTPLELPEITKDGRAGRLWLRRLPASYVLKYLEASEAARKSEDPAESSRALRTAMLEFVRQAVVTSADDATLLFADISDDKLREYLSINAFNRIVNAITELSGLSGGVAAAGKDSEPAADTASSPSN